MEQYYSYDDFLIFLQAKNPVWNFALNSGLKVLIAKAVILTTTSETTIQKTCSLKIINGMAEIPLDLYSIQHSSLAYSHQGQFLHFNIATGNVSITYLGIPIENGYPLVSRKIEEFVVSYLEKNYAKMELIKGTIGLGVYREFKNEYELQANVALTHTPSRQDMEAALFAKKWAYFFNEI